MTDRIKQACFTGEFTAFALRTGSEISLYSGGVKESRGYGQNFNLGGYDEKIKQNFSRLCVCACYVQRCYGL